MAKLDHAAAVCAMRYAGNLDDQLGKDLRCTEVTSQLSLSRWVLLGTALGCIAASARICAAQFCRDGQ